ncbi:hypothetical protein J4G33_06285 [Actinotalea sp. BY-33]|uniref:Uncharacterized protein n=1 Tax=Actinotalea soli TaxID=2819234 RepID=A0A939LPD3_9CELL|nr:hypothetical protein [Actinotalea soli]MBO1751408.1 hypothetical protein [Actinotalea soli]
MSISTVLEVDLPGCSAAAEELHALAGELEGAGTVVATARQTEWDGDAGDAYRSRMATVVTHLDSAAAWCESSASAIETFGDAARCARAAIDGARDAAAAAGLTVTASAVLAPAAAPVTVGAQLVGGPAVATLLEAAHAVTRAEVDRARGDLEVARQELVEALRSAEQARLPSVAELLPDGGTSLAAGVVRSDVFGAFVLQPSKDALARYRRFPLLVPRADAPMISIVPRPAVTTELGIPLVQHRSGLFLPQYSSADPAVLQLKEASQGPTFHRLDRPTLVTDAGLGRPPTWARVGGRSLGAAGTGLTVYDAYARQWEEDRLAHPGWTEDQRVLSATTTAAVEGGATAGGAWVGAKLGAAAGSFFPIPVVGTVGGALIGAAIGAFVGGRLAAEATAQGREILAGDAPPR